MAWREELPDPVEVPLGDVSAVVRRLEALYRRAQLDGLDDIAETLDEVIGRITRWVWPLLGDLDNDED